MIAGLDFAPNWRLDCGDHKIKRDMSPPMTDDLTLPQALLLLCLDDESGKSDGVYFQPAIAGAALAELLLLQAIELTDEDDPKLVPLRHYQKLSAFLAMCDAEIGAAPKPLTLEQWVARLTNIDGLISTVADELCHLGILSKERSSVLGLFSRTVWPTVSPIPEAALKAKLAQIMFDEASPSVRETALLALAKAAGVLPKNFDIAQLNTHGNRIDSITQIAPDAPEDVMKIVQTTIAAIVQASVAGADVTPTIIT